MRRAAVPIFKAVVPGVTQIPPNFGEVSYNSTRPSTTSPATSTSTSTSTTTTTTTSTTTISPSSSAWEDNTDHQLISPGSLHDIHSQVSATILPSTHSSLPPLDDFPINSKDALAMVHRVNNVFENLDLDYTHPTTSALVQVVNDTARDPHIVSRIMRLDSFQNLVSSIPANLSTVERPRVTAPIETSEPEDVQSFINSITSSTQTDDDIFTNSLESRLQAITMQIAPDIGITPPVSATSTSSPSPSLSTTSTSSVSTSSTTSSSSISSSATTNATPLASENSPPAEESVGDAGMPGNTSSSAVDTAVKIILPLAILAVAAAMFPLPRAVDLLKTGIKFVSRLLVGAPV